MSAELSKNTITNEHELSQKENKTEAGGKKQTNKQTGHILKFKSSSIYLENRL